MELNHSVKNILKGHKGTSIYLSLVIGSMSILAVLPAASGIDRIGNKPQR